MGWDGLGWVGIGWDGPFNPQLLSPTTRGLRPAHYPAWFAVSPLCVPVVASCCHFWCCDASSDFTEWPLPYSVFRPKLGGFGIFHFFFIIVRLSLYRLYVTPATCFRAFNILCTLCVLSKHA